MNPNSDDENQLKLEKKNAKPWQCFEMCVENQSRDSRYESKEREERENERGSNSKCSDF